MRCSTLIGVFLASVLAASVCLADGVPTTQASEVTAEQHYLKEHFLKVMEDMEKVAKGLENKDPDSAAAIRAAIKQANDAAVANDIDVVIKALSALQFAKGETAQANVTNELKKMLAILRAGKLNPDTHEGDLEAWLHILQGIIAGQEREETISRIAMNADKFNRQMDELTARIAQIVQAQKTLMQESTGVQSDPQVKKLSDMLGELRNLISQQDAVKLAAASSTIERLPLVAQAQKQLGEQAAALSRKLVVCAEDPLLGQMLKSAGIDAGAAAGASKDVASAVGEMDKAVKSLSHSEPRAAASPQQQALEDLDHAEKSLTAAVARAADTTAAGQLALRQSQLEQQTLEVAQKIDDLTRQIGLNGPRNDSPAKDGPSAPGTRDPAQPQSPATPAGDQPANRDQPAQPATQPAQPAARPAGQQDNLRKAADHMNNAAGQLAGQQPKPAAAQQKEAIARLTENKLQLAQLRDRMNDMAKQPVAEHKNDQDRLANQTDALARKMAQAGDGQKGEGQEPAPGQKAISSAGENQRTASGKLDKNDAAGANSSQKRAIRDLELAEGEIKGRLDQIAQTHKEEDLARIDTMLEQMLARQKECSQATRTIFGKSGGQDVYERQEQLQLKAISQTQGGIGDDAAKVLALIAKEGDSTVFTPALKEVQTDLASVQKMLAQAKAGPLTQRIQSDVENSLEKMLGAVRDSLAQIQRPKQPTKGIIDRMKNPPPPPPTKEQFIPPLAELKLLLTMQKDVNGRTEFLDAQARSGIPTDDLAGQNKVLAQREGMIRDMTQKIATKIHGGAPDGATEDRNIPTGTRQFGPIQRHST